MTFETKKQRQRLTQRGSKREIKPKKERTQNLSEPKIENQQKMDLN